MIEIGRHLAAELGWHIGWCSRGVWKHLVELLRVTIEIIHTMAHKAYAHRRSDAGQEGEDEELG